MILRSSFFHIPSSQPPPIGAHFEPHVAGLPNVTGPVSNAQGVNGHLWLIIPPCLRQNFAGRLLRGHLARVSHSLTTALCRLTGIVAVEYAGVLPAPTSIKDFIFAFLTTRGRCCCGGRLAGQLSVSGSRRHAGTRTGGSTGGWRKLYSRFDF